MTPKKGSNRRGTAALWVVGVAAPVAALQAGVTNYTYDELGRLVRVSDTRNGDRVYAYDPAGNRTQMVVGAPRVGEVLEAAPADPAEKVYSASNAPPTDELSPPVAPISDSGTLAPAIDSKVSEPEPRPVNVR
jgi:YD repeat-containing protein